MTGFDNTGAHVTDDPNKRGDALLIRAASSRAEEPFDEREVFPATLMIGPSHAPIEQTPFVSGCVDVMSQVGPIAPRFTVEMVEVCRHPHFDDARSVNVEVRVWHGGRLTFTKSTASSYHLVQDEHFGDGLRVLVDRRGSGASVNIFTAAEVNPGGTMACRAYLDAPFAFASDPPFQGLRQFSDGFFAGTRLNHERIDFAEFKTTQARLAGAGPEARTVQPFAGSTGARGR